MVGAALLTGGCFLPVISAGDKTLNFFDPIPVQVSDLPENAMLYAGVAIIAIAIVSAILALTNRSKFLWLSGVLTGTILLAVYYGFYAKLDEMKGKADEQVGNLFGGMFKGITDNLFASVELGGIGWYLMPAGAFLLMATAFIKSSNNREYIE